jgi:hypothetical protein
MFAKVRKYEGKTKEINDFILFCSRFFVPLTAEKKMICKNEIFSR